MKTSAQPDMWFANLQPCDTWSVITPTSLWSTMSHCTLAFVAKQTPAIHLLGNMSICKGVFKYCFCFPFSRTTQWNNNGQWTNKTTSLCSCLVFNKTNIPRGKWSLLLAKSNKNEISNYTWSFHTTLAQEIYCFLLDFLCGKGNCHSFKLYFLKPKW